MWITWKHQDSDFKRPLSFEDKVEIFYHQTVGWQLHIADLIANGGETLDGGARLAPIRHSGFAVLHVCLSYFETIGHFEQRDPRTRTSTDYFKAGVLSVFPTLASKDKQKVDALLVRLYKGARCGLYHGARTAPGVGLGQPPDSSAIAYESVSKSLVISPERLPKALKEHLERYRKELLAPKNVAVRKNFERRFDADIGA